ARERDRLLRLRRARAAAGRRPLDLHRRRQAARAAARREAARLLRRPLRAARRLPRPAAEVVAGRLGAALTPRERRGMSLTDQLPEPFWLAGEPARRAQTFTVTSPWDGTPIAEISTPREHDVETAVAAAASVAAELAALPAHVRAEALFHVVRRLEEERD